MNLRERLYVITHEIPNHATAIRIACSAVLSAYQSLALPRIRKTVKPRKESANQRTGIDANHLNRISGNLQQIHSITQKIKEIRDEVSKKMPNKDGDHSEALEDIRKIQEEYADDPAKMVEKIREVARRAGGNPADEKEDMEKPELPFTDEQVHNIILQLHGHALQLLKHKAALLDEFRKAPAILKKSGDLAEIFNKMKLSIDGIYKSVLASIPGGVQTFDLREILRELKSTHLLLQGPGGNKIKVNVSLPEEPIMIIGEKNLLTLVYHNLVSNAIIHKDPKRKLEIQIGAYRSGKDVVSIVSDNGKGIPGHVLPNLFNPTYTGREESDKEHDAHGQGLAIIKEAVKLHKGEIEVESAVGRNSGTSFRIWFQSHSRGRSI